MQKRGRKPTQSLSPATAASTLLAGGLLCLGSCGLGLAVCAWLVLVGRLSLDHTTLCCRICMGIGCFIGGLYSALSSRTRMLAMALGTGLVAEGILTAFGIGCFGGISPQIWGSMIASACVGSGIAGMMAVKWL